MKAIILAAGRGSRMKKLTDDRPKCLTKVRGKTLLEWQLQALQQAGITEIGIVTGYRREQLNKRGLVEFHNSRWAETNMVASLVCADTWLQAGPCIVSYSDIFFSSDAVTRLIDIQAEIALTYDPNWLNLWTKRFTDPLIDAETFRLKSDKSLAEIGKKPHSTDEVEGQFMGLLRFTPLGWGEMMRVRSALMAYEADSMHMTDTLQKVIEAGQLKIFAVPEFGEWGEVDSAEDLKAYEGID